MKKREVAKEKARQAQREADLVQIRISELHEEPISGKFDVDHLKAVHAHIFQDLPDHGPGVMRNDSTKSWIKHRTLEGRSVGYHVYYANEGVETKIAKTLERFGGSESVKGFTLDGVAAPIAELYGALDHAHGFHEGNSRTLREFTRELALAAGYELEWIATSVGASERNELYVARDLAVLQRALPDLTPEKAMRSNDRAEYEASFVIEALRREVGDKSLAALIRNGLRLRNPL
jgi:fido (protein-threonine AMPylation protein)